jgi:hypothetical protein
MSDKNMEIQKLSKKILFIGNSLTYWNNGLEYHLVKLAECNDPSPPIEANSVVKPGATLEDMWKDSKARDLIGTASYDVVVLQDDIPETNVATFQKYVRLFVKSVMSTGAKPVLYMTWPYERLGWITTEEIAKAHGEIALELEIDVAPVGLAWQYALCKRSELDMYGSDREHPSIFGTYLAVNVIYSTIFGMSTLGNTYRPAEGVVSDHEAEFLQIAAWKSLQGCQS